MQPPERPEPPLDRESPPILLVGGSVRAAAESASRVGMPVLASDLFGDRQTRRVAQRWIHLHHLINSVTKSDPSIVIAGGLDQGYEWLSELGTARFGAQPSLFRRVSDPDFLSELAARSAVSFPAIGRSIPPGAPRLFKRRISTGGLGIRFLAGHSLGETVEAYSQQFIPGRSMGASYVSDGERALLVGACRSLKTKFGEYPFVYAGSVGPLSVSEQTSRALTRLGDAFVRETKFSGPFNIDVIDDGRQLWLLEVNPRWSASMEVVERSWMKHTLRACSFFEPFSSWQDRLLKVDSSAMPCFYKRVLFARHSLRIDPHTFPADQPSVMWRDVPAHASDVEPGMPIATLIADFDQVSPRQCRKILRNVVSTRC